ncbi:MAG: peptidoglycan DD-metalloendopeptidase family protein [Marinifilaceae bacterium]|nr:peptidoglycan DD-metalloendopeptidase family protein [Marinifilaceae bacterium]
MWSFIGAIVLLVVGYVVYGKFMERFFGADPKRKTPVQELADGVDYIELPPWKIYVIQFLNIAGLGPIFGAILGAAYGMMAYVWIVLGCIFMGAVHDYMSGMLSMRLQGMGLPDIVGKYLGVPFRRFLVFFTAILLIAVGVSFVSGPATLMANLTKWNVNVWLYIIFVYYILATLLPIDKIIGKVYPILGAALIFMAIAVGGSLLVQAFSGELTLTELSWETIKNGHSNPESNILFPMLFVVISCGAISGFHATQSPLMARCISNEKYGRPIFYGAMITEGIIAIIWATAAIAYCGGIEELNSCGKTPAVLVNEICNSWLGKAGAVIAIIGVVACPITSGDTAFRSLRLIIADALKIKQISIKNRLMIAVPIFILAYIMTQIEFSVLWNYVGISNQMLACITLWTCSMFFVSEKKSYWFTVIPATFLTCVCISYFLVAPHASGGLALNSSWGNIMGMIGATVALIAFMIYKNSISVVHKRGKIVAAMILGCIIIGYLLYPKGEGTEGGVPVEEMVLTGEDSTATAQMTYKYGIPIDDYDIVYGTVERNQTLSTILTHHGLTNNQVNKVVQAAKGVFNVRSMRIGQAYACLRCVDTTLVEPKMEYFVYEDNDEGYVIFDLRSDSAYSATRGYYPVEWHTNKVAGRVESSLWNAMKRTGADPQLAVDMSQIFGWSIDFFGLQKDDEFRVVYDQKFVEGDPLNTFSIRAARFTSNGKTVNAIPFMQDGEILYFDETGNSLEGAFLKAPLDYYRITSRFTNSRFHPVLKRYRAHHGVDYAAPTGTPVYAIGSGKVIEKGYQKNGGGNYIKIRHNSTYTTVYMHLSKFAKGLHVGQQVAQKEVIGYVGSTGLSTGPHLDFRVYENGKPINPLTIKSQPKAPVKPENRADFDALRDSVMLMLDRLTPAGVESVDEQSQVHNQPQVVRESGVV